MIKVIGRYIGIVLVLVLSANLAFAQEGFGTQQPDKSAAIHIESGKRGLLIPRVELTRTNVAAPVITPVAQSLLVYNTKEVNDVSPGYYYWDTDRWVRFAMQNEEPWNIQGTSNDATDNSQNIYQQGKVAVGFTEADGESDKQFEVKGDFKALNIENGVHNGVETNYDVYGFPSSIIYSGNDDPMTTSFTEGSYLLNSKHQFYGHFKAANSQSDLLLMENYTGFHSVSLEGTTYKAGENDITSGFTANDSDAILHHKELEQGHLNAENTASVQVSTKYGVEFTVAQDGNVKEKYRLPRTRGAKGQVLATDGAIGQNTGQLYWTDVQATQLTTTVVNGTNTTVTNTTSGNNTEYQVNVSKGDIQDNQEKTVVAAGTGVTVTDNTVSDVTTYTVATDPSTITLDGDVTGTANATVVEKIQGTPVSPTTPSTQGQVLEFDGTNWTPTIPTVDVGNVVNPKDLTSDGSITVTTGTGATLVDANIKVADDGIDSNHLKNNAVSADKIQGVGNNQVMVTTATGDVAWVSQNDLLANIANGTTTLVSGTGTSTDPYIIEVADGSINTIHLTDGAITNAKLVSDAVTIDKIKGGTEGEVMITNTTGNVVWVDQSEVGEIVDAKNGLNKAGLDIKLGGALTEPTAITTDATQTLAIEGLQEGSISDNMVVADPTSGVLKQVKATPRFFYMPAVIFDTSTPGTVTRDLYKDYKDQFTGATHFIDHGVGTPTMEYTGGLISSNSQATTIATYAVDELDYYVSYYDQEVFKNLSISSDGKLTYTIKSNATEASYMNIIFVVKE